MADEEQEKDHPRSSTANLEFRFLRLKQTANMNMNRPGDWNCRSCQHHNFSRRDSCQRCGDQRSGGGDFGSFGGRGSSSYGFSGSDVRPGDWYCAAGNCGAHNFASRSSCFKCGAFKDESTGGFDGDMPRSRGSFGAGRSGWKSGDWICSRQVDILLEI
ncbi:hypothetical protein IFM89_006770 [Coptis chinensis]|uniref:RanBP2-type domain-containing protein n=1 Tax=Coptis chinensis TaxID=261450 RepID=A0A835M786_9MAGN|nr:hypothetical protein IFM89_006770 [Coptis chinensis]